MIGISLGTAIKENAVVGLNMSYGPSKYTSHYPLNEITTEKSTVFEIGPYYRKYKTLGKGFHLFGQVDFTYSRQIAKTDFKIAPTDSKRTSNAGAVSVTPGLAYRLFKILHVELFIPNILRMRHYVNKTEYQDPAVQELKEKGFDVRGAFTNGNSLGLVGIGFRFIL